MCQMSVYMDKGGVEELVLEDVTRLVVEGAGVTISTLFEGPKQLTGAAVHSIDFIAGKVLLRQNS